MELSEKVQSLMTAFPDTSMAAPMPATLPVNLDPSKHPVAALPICDAKGRTESEQAGGGWWLVGGGLGLNGAFRPVL